MKIRKTACLALSLILSLISPGFLAARNAPVTTLGSSTVCPGGSVIVPVTVTNFVSIKAITLRVEFNPTQLTYVNFSNLYPSLASASVNMVNISPTLSKIMFVWAEVTALNLPNGTKLLNLNFTLTSGSPQLNFNNTVSGGSECEYADENGVALNDVPTSTYYLDATITNNSVPAAGTITGPGTLCAGATNNGYSVQPIPNATSYIWTVPAGGSIISGNNTSAITVNYSATATSGNVTVKGTNTCGSGAISTLPVTINPVPSPAISGPGVVCAGSAGSVYSTTTGMSNYTWTVSSGGSITSGSGTSSVTVDWNTAGSQSVSVNYANSFGCPAPSPTVKAVTVNPQPVPTISGPSVQCAGSSNVIYTTESGMTNYTWSISSGGLIISGSTTNAIHVIWTTAGSQWLSVNYTVPSTGCEAANPTIKSITVNPLPQPTITGAGQVCMGATNVVYTTEPGMLNYQWGVSSGGSVMAGGGSNQNSITISWTSSGNQWVSVNYTSTSNCSGSTPTFKTVSVTSLPVPALTGPTVVCSGFGGNVYTTDASMINYQWNVSSGGSITAGGGSADNSVTVFWNTASPQTVSVNFISPGNCTAANPTVANITVQASPVPTITGPGSSCEGSNSAGYSTEFGMSNYQWSVSPGGSILSGTGSNAITVGWSQPGAQTITVNYTGANGCAAPDPVQKAVTVDPLPGPSGSITGITEVCAGSSGIPYSVAPVGNATSYQWTLPMGATLASGLGSNNVTVNFSNSASSGPIVVEGHNNCGNGPPSPYFPVTLYQIPGNPGAISGPDVVCAGTNGAIYSVAPITGAMTYDWTLPAGAVIATGAGTNQIMVTFGMTAGTGIITVTGHNVCGNGPVSAEFHVTIIESQGPPLVTANGPLLTSSEPTGNQWYYEGTGAIPGAIGQTYTATITGWYWTAIQGTGCPVLESNHVYVLFEGTGEMTENRFLLYPVPCDGLFTLQLKTKMSGLTGINVYNRLGERIYSGSNEVLSDLDRLTIDLRPVPAGLYTVVITGNGKSLVKKLIVR